MTSAPLDPDLVDTARAMLTGGPAAFARLRGVAERGLAEAAAALPQVDSVDLLAPGSPPVPVRVFRPKGDVVVPVFVWIHGGGFTAGSAADLDRFCEEIARRLDIAVANVEHRLAPETRYPGPLEDCYAALRHVHASAGRLRIDPGRIAVGGASSGAAPAAGTALLARDRGEVPLVFQLLDVPMLDDRLTTGSIADFTGTPGFTGPGAAAAWAAYLPEDGGVPAYAAPARADDLAGLPPTYLAAMQLDPVRDEGIAYAQRLLAAGVRVELHSFPGTFHGSEMVHPTAPVSLRAAEERLRALARGLSVDVDDRVRLS